MEQALELMTAAIAGILHDAEPSIYLYGSATLGDYRPGWSDVDLLVLTEHPITIPQSERLLALRQDLPLSTTHAFDYHSFEGGMLSLDAFLNRTPDRVVYWGTSGQRLAEHHHFDCFSLWLLHHHGLLLHGQEVRSLLPIPTPSDLHSGVAAHLRTIEEHGHGGRSLYAFGWLLDTARGLYTLQHDAVVSKTAAGTWALGQHLCPDEDALRLALDVRREPSLLQNAAILAKAERLTPAIAGFAAVLRQTLTTRGVHIPG